MVKIFSFVTAERIEPTIFISSQNAFGFFHLFFFDDFLFIKKVGRMNIGIIGSGVVAKTLAAGFIKNGYNAVIGTRSPEKLKDWVAQNPKCQAKSFADAAAFGEVIVLAVKGAVAAEALRLIGASKLSGKIIMDATNPIASAPSEGGVLKYFTTLDGSLMEQLQKEFPESYFVKAFNSVGSARMVNPVYKEGKPTMFICGNNPTAKKTVENILDKFGWESADMGGVEAARAIEPLAMLWCIPGFMRNEWNHAFKLLKAI